MERLQTPPDRQRSAAGAAGRLGVLIPEFPSQTHAFFRREIEAWRSAGHAVSVISTRRPPDDACRHDWADEARRETHYLYPPRPAAVAGGMLRRPHRWAGALAYIASLHESPARRKARALALLASAADLRSFAARQGIGHVHCHSFADAAHVCAMARLLGGPTYSLTLHGDLPVYGVDHAAKVRHCLAVTTAGPHLVEPVAAIGFPRERILSNPMGVDTERFRPADATSEDTDARLRLITVARLNRNKGHRFALAAMRRLVEAGFDLYYTIVGEGPYRPDLEREIREANLESRVTLAGSRAEAEVLAMLREHDAFLLPSVGLGEAAPVSVMEAMACGLPVIASIIGSTPEMIRDGETGFLTPQEDVSAIEAALRRLAEGPALRRQLGDAARAAAVERFDARASSLRLLDHLVRCGAAVA